MLAIQFIWVQVKEEFRQEDKKIIILPTSLILSILIIEWRWPYLTGRRAEVHVLSQ